MKPESRHLAMLNMSFIFLMIAWFLPWGGWIGRNWGMSVRAGFTVAFGIWYLGSMTLIHRHKGVTTYGN